jgi:probable phosphoglycerate mutase
MRLTFARHGESEANVQEVYWNAPQGYGLTPKGEEQAAALADLLAGVCYAGLYCSPVLRAVQTAQIVGRRLGLAPQIADGLREYDVGILEGRTYDASTHELYWRVLRQWMEDGDWEARIEGGESYNDMRARFMPFVRGLQDVHGGTDAHVLLIAHGGILRCMLPLLLSNVDRGTAVAQHFDYATPIVAEQRGDEWVCLTGESRKTRDASRR